MLDVDDVRAIALDLLHRHKLTGRQYSCWLAARMNGLSFREAANHLRDTGEYDISHWTVMEDSRYAHQIVVQACQEREEGRLRFGHTLAAGADTWFSPDTTLQTVVRKTRGVINNARRA